MPKDIKYEEKKFSGVRQLLSDFNEEAYKMPNVVGLIEADITDAREIIKEYEKKSGKRISFTGWVAKCVAQGVSEHKRLNAFVKGKKKLIVFEHIDISVMVERKTSSGKDVAINHVIRETELKDVKEISEEIRELQLKVVQEKDQLVRGASKYLYFYFLIPKFIRRLIVRKLLKNPFYVQRTAGTVGITSLGMHGKNLTAWAIPFGIKTLNIAVAGIGERYKRIDGKPVFREILFMTFLVNHNIVDGAPATRFISRTVELMENAYGLEEL
ncbi:MAG: 2-oxo acid dehydrogenase subunit E2 [Candidatus Heimdallarchaeota archaeon]|nr:2-oxo acid dehydrogenase subunit E2 [Candidatus Heimdallarchaeota archaeon]MCK4954323.1 2-oxo acid dehydrogenase subunit E2 [Candidatus Heimdallarchaeota archaeon]